jgi:hypothetical protein
MWRRARLAGRRRVEGLPGFSDQGIFYAAFYAKEALACFLGWIFNLSPFFPN